MDSFRLLTQNMEENIEVEEHNDYKHVDLRNNEKRADILVKVFTLYGIVVAFSSGGSIFQIKLLQDIRDNNPYEMSVLELSDMVQMIFAIGCFGLYIATIVVFLQWFRRAYFNLHLYKRFNLRHSESMASYGFFIPLLYLFWPFQIMRDIWLKTQDEIKNFNPSFTKVIGNPLIDIWWALFVISNIFGQIILRKSINAEDVNEVLFNSQLNLASDLLQIIEVIIVILMVKKVSRLERTLFNYNEELLDEKALESFEEL